LCAGVSRSQVLADAAAGTAQDGGGPNSQGRHSRHRRPVAAAATFLRQAMLERRCSRVTARQAARSTVRQRSWTGTPRPSTSSPAALRRGRGSQRCGRGRPVRRTAAMPRDRLRRLSDGMKRSTTREAHRPRRRLLQTDDCAAHTASLPSYDIVVTLRRRRVRCTSCRRRDTAAATRPVRSGAGRPVSRSRRDTVSAGFAELRRDDTLESLIARGPTPTSYRRRSWPDVSVIRLPWSAHSGSARPGDSGGACRGCWGRGSRRSLAMKSPHCGLAVGVARATRLRTSPPQRSDRTAGSSPGGPLRGPAGTRRGSSVASSGANGGSPCTARNTGDGDRAGRHLIEGSRRRPTRPAFQQGGVSSSEPCKREPSLVGVTTRFADDARPRQRHVEVEDDELGMVARSGGGVEGAPASQTTFEMPGRGRRGDGCTWVVSRR